MAKERELTGYPSIDKPWLKYYYEGAESAGYEYPKGKCLWDFYKETLIKQGDEYPAIQYFGRHISRSAFISRVELWEKAFSVMNVKPGEIVVLFGPAFPEFCEIFMALNALAAIPYFLKIDSSKVSLAEESEEARIAVVFEDMWNQVESVFTTDRFEHIIIVSAADSMPFPLKAVIKAMNIARGTAFSFIKHPHCISVNQVLKKGNRVSGPLPHVPFQENRIAAITVSSGTTASGVKGIMDTNESILASIHAERASQGRFIKGRKVLMELPLMASTSLNCLFLMPLFSNMTIVIDPRIAADAFFDHIMKYKPAATISPSNYWEVFFRDVETRVNRGEKPDLSFADGFSTGGSGTTPEKYQWMNDLMQKCGSSTRMFNGYGLSEVFGIMTAQKVGIQRDHMRENNQVIDAGIPLPGFVISVHDEQGSELKYGERGELWVSSPTIMHGYYKKPELTSTTLIDGQIHTGDLCSIDEDGHLYVYGRLKDSIDIDGVKTYLFDIANDIRNRFSLADCLVEKKELENDNAELVMYLAQRKDRAITDMKLIGIINNYCSGLYNISGYKVYPIALPINPATLKTRTNDLNGFVNYNNGIKVEIAYQKLENGKLKKSLV